MQQADFVALAEAAQSLESTSLATRMSQIVGMPIEKALAALPGHWSTIVARITKAALKKALDGALYSLKPTPAAPLFKTHKFLAGLSGAIGGSLGIAALAIELPLSATIMLRSIAEIARSEGENLEDMNTKMACLTVFALSGGNSDSESADTSYYAVRSFLSKALSDTSRHIAVRGLSSESAPAIVKLLSAVSTRFSVPVTEKLAAQLIPAIGLVGGAAVNLLFINHYQKMAKAHFTVRRLERIYGEEVVRKAYTEIVASHTETKQQIV